MSSMPFQLGIPVVDVPPVNAESFILRSKDQEEMKEKLFRMRRLYGKNDIIKVCYMGYRPDRPVPTATYFAEIAIERGKGKLFNGRLDLGWHDHFTGLR